MKKSLVLLMGCLSLVACSKKTAPITSVETPAEQIDAEEMEQVEDISAEDVKAKEKTNQFLTAFKQDFAKQFVLEATETCTKRVGDATSESNGGSPITYLASGDVQWEGKSFNYIKEPDTNIMFSNSAQDKIFTLNIDVHRQDERVYSAHVMKPSMLPMMASVSDEAIQESSSCNGKNLPAIVQTNAWDVVAKHMQFKPTKMNCIKLGSAISSEIEFSFDGIEIHAGSHVLTKADALHHENLFLEPNENSGALKYQVAGKSGNGAIIGMNQQQTLVFSSFTSADGHMLNCVPTN